MQPQGADADLLSTPHPINFAPVTLQKGGGGGGGGGIGGGKPKLDKINHDKYQVSNTLLTPEEENSNFLA